MTTFQHQIEKNLFKSKTKDGIKVFHEISFILAKEFGWSFHEIGEAPIPFIIGVLIELEGFKKKEMAAYNKKRSK